MTDWKSQVLDSIASHKAHVAIIGLGYVGLPLAAAFVEAGYQVTGIDIDPRKTDAVNAGQSYIEDLTSDALGALVSAGKLAATTNFSVPQECDAVSICVDDPDHEGPCAGL